MTSRLFIEIEKGNFPGSTMTHHGLGVMVFSNNKWGAIGYRGSTPGYVSIMAYQPQLEISIAILTNSYSPDPNSKYRSIVESTMFSVFDELNNMRT